MIKHTNRFHIDDTTDDVVKDYIINHCKINGINYRGAQIKYSEYRNRYNTISNIGTGEYSILIYYAEDSFILIGSLYKTNYGDGIEVVSGVSTFTDNVNFEDGVLVSSGATILSGSNITIGNDVNINIGAASDLVIKHSTAEGASVIDQQGTGSLIFKYG